MASTSKSTSPSSMGPTRRRVFATTISNATGAGKYRWAAAHDLLSSDQDRIRAARHALPNYGSGFPLGVCFGYCARQPVSPRRTSSLLRWSAMSCSPEFNHDN